MKTEEQDLLLLAARGILENKDLDSSTKCLLGILLRELAEHRNKVDQLFDDILKILEEHKK